MLVEDCTDEEQASRPWRLETANLRLVAAMAERLSNEVGNAVTQLSTHQQLFAAQKDDPDFLVSLQSALDDGVHRMSRLARQMMYLSRDLPSRVETVPLEQVIRDAFEEAQPPSPGPGTGSELARMGAARWSLQGERPASNTPSTRCCSTPSRPAPRKAIVSVKSSLRSDDRGQKWVDVEIRDAGAGFHPQTAAQPPSRSSPPKWLGWASG